MATNNSKNQPTGSTGKIMQGQGIGTASTLSTSTYPSTATGTGKILRADGTNWVPTTATFPDTAGANGNVLTSDGTNWNSQALTSGGLTLVTGTLTNSQIKNLKTTPIAIVAGQGSGKIIVPLYISMTMNYGGNNPFTTPDGTIRLKFPNATNSDGIASLTNACITASSSQFYSTRSTSSGQFEITRYDNQPIRLTNSGAANITGNAANDNTMSWEFLYYVMTP